MVDTPSASDSRIISLAYLTIRGTPPWEHIDCARDCGFSHVGLRFNPVLDGEALMPVVGHSERMLATEKRLKDTGIKLLDVEFFWIKSDTEIQDFAPYLEAAARLGAKNLLAGAADPDKNRFTDNWLELCALAAAHNLQAQLEFMPLTAFSAIGSYAEAINLMKNAPHPAAAVMIDAMHFFRSGSRVAEILPEHHRFMREVQLCDAPAGQPPLKEMERQAREDRLPPGQGRLDLTGLLKALPASLPISVETPVLATQQLPPRERAKLVYNATRELLGRLDAEQNLPALY